MANKETARGGRLTSQKLAKSDPAQTGKSAKKPAAPAAKTSRQQTNPPAPKSKATTTKTAGKATGKASDKSTGKSTASKPRGGKAAANRGTIAKHETTAQQLAAWSATFRQNLKDPAYWERLRNRLPPWADELGGLLLIVAGVIALTALFNSTTEAVLAVTLSSALRQLFGGGSYFVALGVLGLGVALLLPKFGIHPRFGWLRLAALEIAFVSLTALLHLAANDPEPRVLAGEGGGGGYLGWAVSELALPLGRTPAIVLYAVLLVVGAIVASGVRVRHIVQAIGWLRNATNSALNRLEATDTTSAGQLATQSRLSHVTPLGEDDGSNGPRMPYSRPSIVPRENGEPNGAAPGYGVLPAVNGMRLPTNGDGTGAPYETTDRYFTVEDFKDRKKLAPRADILPPLDLLSDIELNKPTEEEVNTNARIIKNTLLDFDVEVEVIDVKVGPTVTQYAVSPYTESINPDGETVLNRVRVSQIANLNGDLALALSAKRLRIQAPVPGHSYVGVEVPNRQPSTVALRPILESEAFYNKHDRPLALPLGRDVSGEPFVADLASMPHLLIAGTTGSGKSIMLAAMTTAFVLNNPPDRLKLVLLDPKMVELSRFNGLPHLLGPVETELDRIIEVLRWATREMDHRYKLLEQEGARNIETYNRALGKRRQDEHLPYIVIIIDEIGDLMMQRPDETERALTRLAQMARAVGMHLMVATQRPSVDVITGLIKANFPARVSFAVASSIDSRVILDHSGAESLMGRGDMLFLGPDAAGPRRLQGCYVSDEEVNAVVEYWARWFEDEIAAGRAQRPGMAPWERGLTRREVLAETDPMLEQAIEVVIAEQEASASLLQRRLGLGYPRAARIMDLLHELGIVGEATSGGRTREVLVKPGADPFKKIIERRLEDKD